MGKNEDAAKWADDFMAKTNEEALAQGKTMSEYLSGQSQGLKDIHIRWFKRDIEFLMSIKPKQKFSLQTENATGKKMMRLINQLSAEAHKIGESPIFYVAAQSEQLKHIVLKIKRDELKRIEAIQPVGE